VVLRGHPQKPTRRSQMLAKVSLAA
jgi:hypothetical protein